LKNESQYKFQGDLYFAKEVKKGGLYT